MGENAQKIGKKLEEFGCDILSMFMWSEKMRDKQINCNKYAHKNENGNKKSTHGIDLYFEYPDTYINKIQGVFVECKNRQWESVNKGNIEKWVSEEINLLECAMFNDEISEFFAEDSDRNCALLLINVNDGKFDKDKFYEYVDSVEIPNKRAPFKIFIAGNDMIAKWDAIHKMIKSDYKGKVKVIYPSINNSKSMKADYWSINHLFSKYIFCEAEDEVEMTIYGNHAKMLVKRLIIFCFDKICKDSFNYLWSMCRSFQYESQYVNFDICFYADNKEEVDYIHENLMNILKNYEGKIDSNILDNTNVKFLLNRNISAVDNR